MKLLRLVSAISLPLFLTMSAGYSQPPVIDESDEYRLAANITESQETNSIAKSAESDEETWRNEPTIEQQPLVENKNNVDSEIDTDNLAEHIHSLQADIQELRGQIEVQAHDLKMLQQQQLAFYKDLDSRLQKQKTDPDNDTASVNDVTAAIKTAVTENSAKRGNPADEQIRYLAAYELVKTKQFDQALKAMQQFIERYPKSGYTANAHYWMGELFLVQNENEKALQAFNAVLAQFPKSSKAAASELKSGYALANLGQKEAARSKLNHIINQYPDTNTAQLAKQKLESMN